ncbi:MAG: sensor histidine kinase [Candidatus Dormibacteraeota bacterium]|nr:sensor histidine kinase [Candidatus Dormibacteraeota bacterium]
MLDLLAGVGVAGALVLLTPVTRVHQADAVPLDGLGYVLLALCGLSLAVRRRWPLATFLVGVGAAVAYLGLRYAGWPVYVGAGLALIAYASATAWSGWPLALAGSAALGLADGRPEGWQPVRMVTVFVALLAIAAFTAYAAEASRRRAEELARHRVVEERLRIAREMHDVLSHSLATISLQSGTGLRLFKTRPAEAERALETIRRVSGDALAQARTALAAIRDPVDGAEHSGAGLEGLGALFASARSTGLAVQASVALGDEAAITPEVASAAYRVVQESLTNVMRHAGPGAEAAVAVRREGGEVVVEVTDTGVGSRAAPPAKAPGHGLIGMRERVLGLGGRFSAGPEPEGGFRVSARLPARGGAP